MSVADEIRRIKLRKSEELKARERRAAKRKAGQLEKHLQHNRAPGALHDPGFVSQLDRKAREARERMGEQPRPDLDKAIAAARLKGHLPPGHDGATAPLPTAEEILGDEALPKPPALSDDTEELPDAEAVLNTPVEGSTFTREELDEIARMNPARPGQQQGKHRRRR